MNFRTTIILAVLLALASALYFGMEAYRERQVRMAEEARRLHDWAPEAIVALRIEQLGKAPVAAERNEEGWNITAPNPTIRPFGPLWDRAAQAAAELRNERTVEESPGDLSRFGLADPLLQVEAQHEDGTILNLSFGSQEPTRTYRYAMLQDELVFLAPENQYFELNRSLRELRHQFLAHDRSDPLLRIEFAHIWTGDGEIELANPPMVGEESEPIVLERENPDAPWVQLSPIEAPANQELVTEFAQELQGAVTHGHIDQPTDLADYGLNPARARVSLVSQSHDKPVTLYFGGFDETENGGIFTRRVGEEAIFLTDPHITSLWPRMVDHFRERHLFTHTVTDVRKLEYENTEGRFVLEKGEDGWRMIEPAIPDIDLQAVTNFFVRLKGLEATDLSLQASDSGPLDDPAIQCTIYLEGQDAPVVVRLAPNPAQDGSWLVRQDTGAEGRIRADDAQALQFTADQFRSMTLLRVDPATVRELEFVFEGTGYRLEKVHDQWVVRAPENHYLQNQNDAATLLALFNPLTAVSGIPEVLQDDQSVYGFDQPVLAAYLHINADDDARRLGPVMIGQPVDTNSQERYAFVEGREGVFRVSQDLVHRFRDALRGIQPK